MKISKLQEGLDNGLKYTRAGWNTSTYIERCIECDHPSDEIGDDLAGYETTVCAVIEGSKRKWICTVEDAQATDWEEVTNN